MKRILRLASMKRILHPPQSSVLESVWPMAQLIVPLWHQVSNPSHAGDHRALGLAAKWFRHG